MTDVNINSLKIKQMSITTLFDSKSKPSFCWRYFGDLVVEEDNKKKKINNEQVFCNACLSGAQDENDEISFRLAKIRSYARTVSTGNLSRHLRDVHSIVEASSSNKAAKNITESFATAWLASPATSTPSERVFSIAGLLLNAKRSRLNPARVNSPQPRPRAAANSQRCSSIKKRDSWLLGRDIALWFCKSLMPFDSVSDEGIIDFFQKYDIIATKEDMPSRDTISRTALDGIYDSMLANVKAQITTDAVKHAAVTFDLWTDQYRHLNYITFSLHYLTADFELKSYTLCTKLIEGKKTGEKIQKMLYETKERFDLQEKELYSVTDAPFSLSVIDSHLCLGHGLHNLVTVDGIGSVPEVETFVNKCKKIVRIIRYRLPDLEREAEKEQVKFLQLLERVSENLESDENQPITDEEAELKAKSPQVIDDGFGSIRHVPSIKTSTPTRWHIVLTMLESLANFCNRNPVNNMLTQVGHEDLKIYQQEWILLEDLIRFLRKFREAVEMLSTQKTASLNLALVFHLEIKDILNSLSDEEMVIMVTLKNKMLAKLERRFPITENVVIAALLDPRFINLSLIDAYLESKHSTRASFLAEQLRKKGFISSDAAPAAVSSTRESLLSKLAKKHCSGGSSFVYETDAADQECWRYLAAATTENLEGDDILKYWRVKKTAFPMLSLLARAVLAIPATSMPSERVFSEAGLVLNAKRSRLNPTHVNKVVFIHDNYKLCAENVS